MHSNRRKWCTAAVTGPLGGVVPCKGECGWQVGSSNSERGEHAREQAGGGPRGGEVASAGRGRSRVWAGNRPSQGGMFLSFFISYFHFLFLFLLSPFFFSN